MVGFDEARRLFIKVCRTHAIRAKLLLALCMKNLETLILYRLILM